MSACVIGVALCHEFDWIQFLRLAQSMSGYPHPTEKLCPECEQRTIINRSYYAAFNIVKAYIREVEPLAFGNWSKVKHADVSGWLLSHEDEDLKLAGRRLRESFDNRWEADYKDVNTDPAGSASTTLNLAERVVKIVNKRRADTPS